MSSGIGLIIGFAIIGVITTIISMAMFCYYLILYIKDTVEDYYKRKHPQKHRFDKLHTAKCYCIDCKYRTEYKDCCILGRFVADNWFCWKAEPKD